MAEKLKFKKDLDAPVPGKRSIIAYKAGEEYTVPQWVVDLAVPDYAEVIADRSKPKKDE